MNINTKQYTLFNRNITTYWPLLPRDHNNCSTIALPISWHHVGDKTPPGPQMSKVMRDNSLRQKFPQGPILLPGSRTSKVTVQKKTNTIQNDISPSYTGTTG